VYRRGLDFHSGTKGPVLYESEQFFRRQVELRSVCSSTVFLNETSFLAHYQAYRNGFAEKI
jgi:hypothetical protein